MDKLPLLVVSVVLFCAVFATASAQDYQLTPMDQLTSFERELLENIRNCPNNLLDDRVEDKHNFGFYDRMCTDWVETVFTPEKVYKALQLKTLVAIVLKFDGNGNFNITVQNQFIDAMNTFFQDSKKTAPNTWTPIVEDVILQFGDDSKESQKNLDNILSSKAVSKTFESNILKTIWKFKNAIARTRYASKFNCSCMYDSIRKIYLSQT